MTEGFRGPKVCQIVGISYRQLDYWVRTKLISPTLINANGSGSRRVFAFKDLVVLKIIKNLIDAGISLPAIRKAIDFILEALAVNQGSAHIMISKKQVHIAYTSEEILSFIGASEGVISLLAINPIIKQIETTVNSLGLIKEAERLPLFQDELAELEKERALFSIS